MRSTEHAAAVREGAEPSTPSAPPGGSPRRLLAVVSAAAIAFGIQAASSAGVGSASVQPTAASEAGTPGSALTPTSPAPVETSLAPAPSTTPSGTPTGAASSTPPHVGDLNSEPHCIPDADQEEERARRDPDRHDGGAHRDSCGRRGDADLADDRGPCRRGSPARWNRTVGGPPRRPAAGSGRHEARR